MKRSTEQILTTHTGALPRPQNLRESLARKEYGEPVDGAQVENDIARAVHHVVAQQVATGLTVINDGENSKYSFTSYVKDRLTGFEPIENAGTSYFGGTGAGREERDFPEYFATRPNLDAFVRSREGAPRRVCCTGPIGWKDFAEVERDIANLKAALGGVQPADVFMSASSPGNVLVKFANRNYANNEAYLEAIAEAMRREYQAIIDAGFVLQLDCPDLASRSSEDFSVKRFRAEIELAVEALNHATRGLPPEQMRIHVCWGSDERPHHLDPELKDFVDILLKARPAGLTIVAANGRHEHEWAVWKDVKLPDGKVLIPGVIDSTTNIVEHPETVAERIVRFAGVVGRENLIAGVDCGFQTTAGRDQVDPKVAWAKLRSLAEGARLATQRLWH